ncbi:hypothetical protein D9757_005729 [Collybiopsis confluens]|uniref:Uncharacterized protein n=1 Tax=Collybiopsis confluens TaxID=2823264 RepID=A0A8H5MBB8_9AGAR|nr:hypothetical protein D9757_005729 [Collybiopsis confluens]
MRMSQPAKSRRPHSYFSLPLVCPPRTSMKFPVSVLAVTLALTSLSLANPAHLVSRVPDPVSCIEYEKYLGTYHLSYEPSCINLVESCKDTIISNNATDIWGIKSCVAAATCQGVVPLISIIQCEATNVTVPDPAQLNNLNYNIYAGIVGQCAWQEGGCPITQQNYIDFVYGALSDVGTSSWPDVNSVIDNWWQYITKWTATGETVPYTNFNDWLHYSNSS